MSNRVYLNQSSLRDIAPTLSGLNIRYVAYVDGGQRKLSESVDYNACPPSDVTAWYCPEHWDGWVLHHS
jgi:hypothetical protein